MFDFDFSFLDPIDMGQFDFGQLADNPFSGLEIDFSQFPELEQMDLSGFENVGLSPEEFAGLFDSNPFAGIGGGSGGGSGGGGGGSSSSPLAQIARLFGGSGNGLEGLLPLLGAAGTIFGGINQRNATQEATQRMTEAADKANTDARQIYFDAVGRFNPFSNAGYRALDKLEGMPNSNLAGKFAAPLGQPSNIASQFQPLGSGRSLRSLGGR